MTGLNKRVFEMLLRLVVFSATYPQFFGKETLAGRLMAQIEAAVQQLSAQVTSQTTGKGAAKTSADDRRNARVVLREQLEKISRTAKSLKLVQFWMPRERTDVVLVSVGEMWALHAEPVKQLFIDSHMPADFIEKLNVAVRDLKRAIDDQTFSVGTRRAATAAIEAIRSEALTALQQLDAIMENLLRDNPPVLAVWESARHVQRYSSPKPAEPEASTDANSTSTSTPTSTSNASAATA